MKLLKSLAILGLSSFLVANTTQAAEKDQPAQAQTQKRDVKLEQFNKNVGIRFTQRGLQAGENNQPVVTLTYVVENRGKNKIKSLNWVSAYEVNNEAFYLHDIPVNFKPALAANQQVEVTVSIPVAQLPEPAQKFFTDREASITSVNGAKNVAFTNGKRIVVSK